MSVKNPLNSIAVTGATGFIGPYVLEALLERNFHIRILSRTNRNANVPGVEIAPGDITDPESLDKLVEGCKFVIHLAGLAHAQLRKRDMHRVRAVNVEGTRNILTAAANSGVRRVVLISSSHVYADQSGLDITEDAPLASNNLYAQSKIEAEALAREASKTLEVVIARPCLIYGPFARFNLQSLLRAVDSGYYFHIGKHSPVRSFLSVVNASKAFVHLLHNGVSGQAYNIADSKSLELFAFVNELADWMGRRRPRTVSSEFVNSALAMTSSFRRLGFGMKVEDSLRKLTASFSLSTVKLAGTGFEWNEDNANVRRSMVNTYLGEKNHSQKFQHVSSFREP